MDQTMLLKRTLLNLQSETEGMEGSRERTSLNCKNLKGGGKKVPYNHIVKRYLKNLRKCREEREKIFPHGEMQLCLDDGKESYGVI